MYYNKLKKKINHLKKVIKERDEQLAGLNYIRRWCEHNRSWNAEHMERHLKMLEYERFNLRQENERLSKQLIRSRICMEVVIAVTSAVIAVITLITI